MQNMYTKYVYVYVCKYVKYVIYDWICVSVSSSEIIRIITSDDLVLYSSLFAYIHHMSTLVNFKIGRLREAIIWKAISSKTCLETTYK